MLQNVASLFLYKKPRENVPSNKRGRFVQEQSDWLQIWGV